MFGKVSNSDIFYMASFRHVMISAKIIALRVWPEVKLFCHLRSRVGFFFFKSL